MVQLQTRLYHISRKRIKQVSGQLDISQRQMKSNIGFSKNTEFSKNTVLRRHYSKSWKLRGLNFTSFTRKNFIMEIKCRERDWNTAFSHARPAYRFYFSPSRLYPTWEPVHRLSKISFECHVFLVLNVRRKQ